MAGAIDGLALRQLQDYQARTPGTCFAEPGFALDLMSAYVLQDGVSRLRVGAGERVFGYKVGCTGPGTVAQFGMQGPIRGTLFEDEVRHDGDVLDHGSFANLAIEGEMALRIGDDGDIAAAFPIIELHNFVFRAPRKSLSELIANNGLNAGIVAPGAAWLESRTYIDQQAMLSVRINDAVVDAGDLWPLPGGPVASLSWLKRHLVDLGLPLLPGHVVLAGTPLGLYPVQPRDRVAVHVDGQLAVHCSVGASK